MYLNSKNFINSNTNKNVCGFLLIDIVLGMAIFMGMSYYCLLILTKQQCLLETYTHDAVFRNTCALIGKNVAYADLYNVLSTNHKSSVNSGGFQFALKKMSFVLCNGREIAVELVIVKSDTINKINQCAYYVSKKV
jgi:hypothetical protein